MGRDFGLRAFRPRMVCHRQEFLRSCRNDLGFMWFGTQYGLNRFDGYKFKIFKHEPGRSNSLSGVFIYSLFKDRSGALWIGCDGFLDKFEPITETFIHYRISDNRAGAETVPVTHISQDHSGSLWLSTTRGLYSFDPATERTTRYGHDPDDPYSLSSNDIKSSSSGLPLPKGLRRSTAPQRR